MSFVKRFEGAVKGTTVLGATSVVVLLEGASKPFFSPLKVFDFFGVDRNMPDEYKIKAIFNTIDDHFQRGYKCCNTHWWRNVDRLKSGIEPPRR